MVDLTIDDTPQGADWLRRKWRLPPYKSKEFLRFLKEVGASLEDFRGWMLYKTAVKAKLIVDDEWVGPAKSKG